MILLHRRIDVEISSDEAGAAFAKSSDTEQAEFLLALAREAGKMRFLWNEQCLGIAERLSDEDRLRISEKLQTLVLHLNS